MNNRRILILVSLTLLLICFCALEAWAGPGGKIAKVLFTTFWGKLLMLVLFILLLPLILYSRVRQYFKVRSTMKSLRVLGMKNPQFNWMNLKTRLTDVFTRTHLAWGKEDMGDVSEFCTSWYWQNQQLIHLDRWKNQGLINVSQLNRIKKMEPIFVSYSGLPNGDNSLIVVDFDANVEDYLMQRDSGLIVEGKKGFQDVETLWTFRLVNGNWLLDNIEQLEFWSMYIKMPNEVPATVTQNV
ncbi:MAG: Tim44 domain-containing protein [Saprospiraceae bacterium]|nr:Tim44 domain-containing protein [Saprospiraceae bacterium]